MKQLKWLTPGRLMLALIATPLVLAALYLVVLAADRYVSESTVALREAGAQPTMLPGSAMMLASLAPSSNQDTLYVQQYVHSLALLNLLESRFKLRDHYGTHRKDLFFTLPKGTSQEDFLDYYRQRVEVRMDELSSTLTVRVQAFDAPFSQQLNRAILDECERFVNEMSQKMARERLVFAEGELARASQRLQEAKSQLLAFQAKNRLLDPTADAVATGTVLAELNAQITRAETEMRTLQSYLNDDAYQVKALRSQIASLRSQLADERGRATAGTAGKSGERINALAVEFQGLQMQAEFALDAYKLALGTVETARLDASRKIKSLVVIEPAGLPETAEYPRRIYNLLTLLVAVVLLYWVARLVLATVREHQD
jgi:capsular polysaccharide transport system permease protein